MIFANLKALGIFSDFSRVFFDFSSLFRDFFGDFSGSIL